MDLKEKADQLMLIKGNVRGETFNGYAEYIKEKEGKEGLIKMEEALTNLKYPFKFEKIKLLGWYQESYSALIMNILKELFDWTDRDIFNLGHTTPKYSFVLKMLMKHFASLESVLNESPKSWDKYFDFGRLCVVDYSEKEKHVILRLFEYNIDPLMCIYLSGYFLKIAELSVKSDKIVISEKKCIHKGDSYHEFLIEWK